MPGSDTEKRVFVFLIEVGSLVTAVDEVVLWTLPRVPPVCQMFLLRPATSVIFRLEAIYHEYVENMPILASNSVAGGDDGLTGNRQTLARY